MQICLQKKYVNSTSSSNYKRLKIDVHSYKMFVLQVHNTRNWFWSSLWHIKKPCFFIFLHSLIKNQLGRFWEKLAKKKREYFRHGFLNVSQGRSISIPSDKYLVAWKASFQLTVTPKVQNMYCNITATTSSRKWKLKIFWLRVPIFLSFWVCPSLFPSQVDCKMHFVQ